FHPERTGVLAAEPHDPLADLERLHLKSSRCSVPGDAAYGALAPLGAVLDVDEAEVRARARQIAPDVGAPPSRIGRGDGGAAGGIPGWPRATGAALTPS